MLYTKKTGTTRNQMTMTTQNDSPLLRMYNVPMGTDKESNIMYQIAKENIYLEVTIIKYKIK